MAKRMALRDGVLAALGRTHALMQEDLGADACLSAKGMTFETESWEIAGVGHLCVMRMSALLGLMLGLLLPLAGATRFREPFASLLWVPTVLILLVLLYQYLATQGVDLPLLRLLAVNDSRIITLESAFAAYMLTFSVRTGRGI